MHAMMRPPFYPTPPPEGSSRLERIGFLRRNYLYAMSLLVPVFIVGLIVANVIAFVCIACWLLQLCGLVALQAQMRTERRRSER